MENFTREELELLLKVIKLAEQHKTASRPYNILAEAGYGTIPIELDTVYNKLKNAVNYE